MSQSEPHSYNISAKLQNGILSIYVHDTITNCKWRQEFTQTCFPANKLYNVAKSLIMAIQEMINSTKHQQNNHHYEHVLKPITILVYNQWCYLTINNSNLPSFALRPIEKESGTQNRKETCTTHTDSSHQAKVKKNVDLFSSNNKANSNQKKKTIIVIDKGLVARNIARFSKVQQTNEQKVSSSTNTKKANKKNKSKKKQPSRPPPTLNRPPTPTATSASSSANNSNFLPVHSSSSSNRPPTPTPLRNDSVILPTNNTLPIPMRPLPSMPASKSISSPTGNSSSSQPFIPAPPVPRKQSKKASSWSPPASTASNAYSMNTNYSYNSNSNNGNGNGAHRQYRAANTNQSRYTHSTSNNNNNNDSNRNEKSKPRMDHYDRPLPPPPSPCKKEEAEQSFQPGQVLTNCEKESSDSYSNSSPTSSGSLSMGGGSGVINICNSPEFTQYSDSDEDDGIMFNTDDEDSSSFKQPSADSSFCRHGSMDSNSGSSDSFLTNDGDEIITTKGSRSRNTKPSANGNGYNDDPSSLYHQSVSVPVKKMKLYDAMTTGLDLEDEHSTDMDEGTVGADEFDCEYSGNRYHDHEDYEYDIVRTPTQDRQDVGSKFGNTNMWMDEYEEVHSDQQEGVKRGAPYMVKRKKYTPRAHNEKPFKLTICVNGDKIDDMVSHVIEQQIAEEEYYEEEDLADEPFYDPNYLGISPYEDEY
eukprot:CAMPEP_0197021748 /NCGR_PEP_ID=MMETSP1384-20130603/2680_1 /TAXON_ID=29189 /ORGANISM="Ammonia sp." /LENGTH=698 /DNA_ID=CAMNT_0042449653 /DNA_START=74 /DNA_END=2170 /DNA_ORIENTATION=+